MNVLSSQTRVLIYSARRIYEPYRGSIIFIYKYLIFYPYFIYLIKSKSSKPIFFEFLLIFDVSIRVFKSNSNLSNNKSCFKFEIKTRSNSNSNLEFLLSRRKTTGNCKELNWWLRSVLLICIGNSKWAHPSHVKLQDIEGIMLVYTPTIPSHNPECFVHS